MIKIYNLTKEQEDIFIIAIDLNISTINILVDGGRSGCHCIEKIDNTGISKIDYIILTHIDNDHINGILKLLKVSDKCKDAVIVYNKFINGLISFKQAEQFEKLIYDRDVIVSYKEYQNNSGDIIFLSVSQRRKLKIDFNKVYITFLAPSKDKVEKLYEYYKYYKNYNTRKRGDYSKVVNQSSIIFILEYKNNAILMTGDGYISDILSSIEKLFDKKITANPIKAIDIIKLPHHGSKENNIGLGELLKKTNCNNVIITYSNKGNVSISDDIAEILKDKVVYGIADIDKLNKLNVKKQEVIKIEVRGI